MHTMVCAVVCLYVTLLPLCEVVDAAEEPGACLVQVMVMAMVVWRDPPEWRPVVELLAQC
jgi:hypothetical protein